MDIGIYRQCLEAYVKEAIQHSNGSVAGIAEYLGTQKVSGLFVRNRTEKEQALKEAYKAFDEHRHWPIEIIVSHLGVNKNVLE